MGENPLVADPDINHARECMENLDFLVVQDIFLSETAEIADVVLPGASYAEKDGTFTATDRRVQLVKQAIEPQLVTANPIGRSSTCWQIKWARLVLILQNLSKIMNEIAALTPIYGGITYDRLINGNVLQWPCPDRGSSWNTLPSQG